MYEAFLAYRLNVDVRIAGKPLQLLTGDLRTQLQLRERAAEEMAQDNEVRIRAAMSHGGGQGGQSDLIALALELHDAQQQVAAAKLDVLLAKDEDLIDLAKAECFSEADKAMIRAAVKGEETGIVALIARLMREVVCGTPRDEVSWPTQGEAIDLSGIDLQSPPLLLDFAAWLRQRPVVKQLTLCHKDLSAQGCSILRCALQEGLLPQLQVRVYCLHRTTSVEPLFRASPSTFAHCLPVPFHSMCGLLARTLRIV